MIKVYNINFIFISSGAILGAIIRWQLNEIFLVNIIGCFLIGFFNTFSIPLKYRLFFAFGFCGSLTTYSGWIFNLFELIDQGLYFKSFINIMIVFFTSFLTVFLGHWLGEKINKLF